MPEELWMKGHGRVLSRGNVMLHGEIVPTHRLSAFNAERAGVTEHRPLPRLFWTASGQLTPPASEST